MYLADILRMEKKTLAAPKGWLKACFRNMLKTYHKRTASAGRLQTELDDLYSPY